jgi:hypothetical protein
VRGKSGTTAGMGDMGTLVTRRSRYLRALCWSLARHSPGEGRWRMQHSLRPILWNIVEQTSRAVQLFNEQMNETACD